MVKVDELLERRGVVVPQRTLHRYALESWVWAGQRGRRRFMSTMGSRETNCRSTSAS